MNIERFRLLLGEAGQLALSEQQNLQVVTKPDGSIVTNGDFAVSNLLSKKLKELFPEYDVFSEESSNLVPSSKKVLIIDPIDGTESYNRKQDSWSILIGVMDDFEITGGIIYQPSLDNLYYAFKGQGAWWETKGVRRALKAQGEGELKAVISPKDYEEKEFLAQRNITKTIPLYSAALKIMEVAKGNVDVYPNFRKKCSLWDLIAPSAVLTESGGTIVYESPLPKSFTSPWVNTRFVAVGTRSLTLSFK